MLDQIRGPTLYGLLNQFEDIGGPETYGPEGLTILIALWRKSNKLNWLPSFTMTNTELQVQTGIQTRKTLNVYRKKLMDGGLIEYIAPPLGKSRGDYKINFNLLEPFEVVTSGNSFPKVEQEVVTSGNNPRHTVLNEIKEGVVGIGASESPLPSTPAKDPFKQLLETFCEIHHKFDVDVNPKDVQLMQKMITLGVPVPLIIDTMSKLYKKATAQGEDIGTFRYYEKPIYRAFELSKPITDQLPPGSVPLGPVPKRTYQNRQESQNERLMREIQEGDERDRSRGEEAIFHHQQYLPKFSN